MLNSDQQSEQDRLILLLSDNEKICLDSYLFNSSNKVNAFKLFKGITNDNTEPGILSKRADQWINNRSCRAYLEKYKSIVLNNLTKETYDANNQLVNDLTKEDVQNALVTLIHKTTDIKLKSELLIKLSDIKGYKKQDQTKQEEQIKYYLPLRCESCSFKNTI